MRQKNSGSFRKGVAANPTGKPKGALNGTTRVLKEAILIAAEQAGGQNGLVGYLEWLAKDQPAAFAGLLGRVLPHTIAGDADNPVTFTRIERVIVEPPLIEARVLREGDEHDPVH